MKLHNLIKNPTDLPPVADGSRHQESEDVFVLYRSIDPENGELFLESFGKAFYCHQDNIWYGYHDEPLSRLSDVFTAEGAQEYECTESLRELGYSEDLISQLPRITKFACEDLDESVEYVLTKQIVGWFAIPVYEEFMKDGQE